MRAVESLENLRSRERAIKEQAIDALCSGSPGYSASLREEQEQAADALSALGVPAIPKLIAMLRDEHQTSSRIAIGDALARIGRPAWTPLLAAAEESGDLDFGWSVAWALQKFAPACGIDEYLAALRHPNFHVRWASALALERFKDGRVVGALVSMLAEDGPEVFRFPQENFHRKVRSCAAQSLQKLGPLAYPALIAALRDANPLMRAGAANALTGSTDASLFEPLAEVAGDSEFEVRLNVVQALAGLAPSLLVEQRPRACDIFLNALLEIVQYAQIAAAKGLCALGAMAADPLMDFVRNSGLDAEHPNARGYAMRAIGCILAKEPPLSELERRTFPLLVVALRERANPPMVRREAAEAIEKSRDPRAFEPLIGALSDPDPWVRQAVTKELGALGDRSAVPMLEEALSVARRELDELDDNEADDGIGEALEDLIWLLERAIAALRGDQPAAES